MVTKKEYPSATHMLAMYVEGHGTVAVRMLAQGEWLNDYLLQRLSRNMKAKFKRDMRTTGKAEKALWEMEDSDYTFVVYDLLVRPNRFPNVTMSVR